MAQEPNLAIRLWVQTFIQKVQDMRRMQNGSKPSIQMVYEACMRGLAQRPERMPTLPERPERMPNPPVEPEIPAEPAQRPERMPNPPVEPEKIPIPPEKPAEPAQKLERLPTPPVEPERIPISPVELEIPAEPENPPMDEVISPLIPRCDKGT
ncbi:hypothetical protein TNCV_2893821 [Trichonephila clavipes]|nr:hypothetical protein TNCV_2893821 [Trichonephila clavipes]